MYLCEFELFEDEGMICAFPFGLEGATCGTDWRDAAEMAADWLKGDGEYRLMLGQDIPELPFGNKPEHESGRVMLVGVDVSLDGIDTVKASEAAERLGVSRSRVSQMLTSQKLMGFRKGRDTYVTRDSLEARLAEQPKAGRPRKKAAMA